MVASPRTIPKPPLPALIQSFFNERRLPQEGMSAEDQSTWLFDLAKIMSVVYGTEVAIRDRYKPSMRSNNQNSPIVSDLSGAGPKLTPTQRDALNRAIGHGVTDAIATKELPRGNTDANMEGGA